MFRVAAGVVLTGYVAAGTIGAGTNYGLDAIAVRILGGMCTMVGGLTIGGLTNGLSVMNIPKQWIIESLVLIFAVFNYIGSKRNAS